MYKEQTTIKPKIRCAIYTRKSTEEGLDQEFNSLDAQRESAESYILSQRHEGWFAVNDRYDDGGFSGGSMDRPALRRLVKDIQKKEIDCVVVYKVDRISRSLADFCKLMDLFEQYNVAFVSVTQSFNTTSSMGRLTLNILLSFAQFEREVIGERIRDKLAAMKRKGMHTGGHPVLGYDRDSVAKKLVLNKKEAKLVRYIFDRFPQIGSTHMLAKELNNKGYVTKSWVTQKGEHRGGRKWSKTRIYRILHNRLYLGQIAHRDKLYPGEHKAIISQNIWDKAHDVFNRQPRSRAAATRARTPALLKGILRCGVCRSSMGITFTRKNGKMYRYYQCLHASKNGYDSCDIKSVAAGVIEEPVMDQLKKIFRSPEIVSRIFLRVKEKHSEMLNDLRDQERRLAKQLSACESKIKKHGDIFDDSTFLLESDLRQIQKESDFIREKLNTILNQISTYETMSVEELDLWPILENFEAIWNELFPKEQARLMQLLIGKVIVYPQGLEIYIRRDGLNSFVTELQSDMTPKNPLEEEAI
ncbi:MAG: recombinase family protein [Candidatus Auribacterota bacterium]